MLTGTGVVKLIDFGTSKEAQPCMGPRGPIGPQGGPGGPHGAPLGPPGAPWEPQGAPMGPLGPPWAPWGPWAHSRPGRGPGRRPLVSGSDQFWWFFRLETGSGGRLSSDPDLVTVGVRGGAGPV